MTERVDVSFEIVESQDARCTEVETLLREHREAMTCLDAEDCVQLVAGLIHEAAAFDECLRGKACSDPAWRCEGLYGKLNAHLMRVERVASGALGLGLHFREGGYEVRGLDTLESALLDLRWMIRPEVFDWSFLAEPLFQAVDEDRLGETEPLMPLPE